MEIQKNMRLQDDLSRNQLDLLFGVHLCFRGLQFHPIPIRLHPVTGLPFPSGSTIFLSW
jgi:hypothetical protein